MAKSKTSAPAYPDNAAKMQVIGSSHENQPFKMDSGETPIPNNEVEFTEGLLPVSKDILVEEKPNQEQEQPQIHAKEDVQEEIPEKYRGKSLHDIIKMHENIEKEVGKHRNEVGMWRSMVDKLLLQQQPTNQPAQSPTASPQIMEEEQRRLLDLMLSRPHEFRQNLIQDVLGYISKVGAQSTMNQLISQNAEILGSPDFQEWVTKNIPTRVSQEAVYDPEKFLLVMNYYKNSKAQQQSQPQSNQISAGPMSAPQSSSRAPTAKIYSRKALLELRINDPARFQSMQPDIEKAYAEGRVKNDL